jgi:hypothetical protein
MFFLVARKYNLLINIGTPHIPETEVTIIYCSIKKAMSSL